MWFICHKCNGEGYIDKKECLTCRFDITADANGENGLNDEGLILRGKKFGLKIIFGTLLHHHLSPR